MAERGRNAVNLARNNRGISRNACADGVENSNRGAHKNFSRAGIEDRAAEAADQRDGPAGYGFGCRSRRSAAKNVSELVQLAAVVADIESVGVIFDPGIGKRVSGISAQRDGGHARRRASRVGGGESAVKLIGDASVPVPGGADGSLKSTREATPAVVWMNAICEPS